MDKLLIDSSMHHVSLATETWLLILTRSIRTRLDLIVSSGCLICERKICAAIKLSLILIRTVVRRSGSLDSLALFVGVILAVSTNVRGALTSQRLALTLVSLGGRCGVGVLSLSLACWLFDSEFLGNEAVFNHLIDVLFLRKWTFVVKIEIAHLLRDV